jgi:catechol 2,3-dioxygenase-like lactoylglutathione lyase family enzyme
VILGFSHLQLRVRDVAASARWWCAVLGLEQFVAGTSNGAEYVGLRHPTAGFVIGMQTAARDGDGSTIDHLAFTVADRDTLERLRADLVARGIDAGELFDEQASHNMRLVDPDGLVLELTAPKRSR